MAQGKECESGHRQECVDAVLGCVMLPGNCILCDFAPFQPFLGEDALLALILMAHLGSLQ